MRSKLQNVLLVFACLSASALSTFAADGVSRVMLKPEISRAHREELAASLRAITGLTNLKFDATGALRLDSDVTTRGSESARALLSQALKGPNVIIIEDASSRSDVGFARVVRGRWLRGNSTNPPAFVVLIDFTDFRRLSGDAEALAAFDVGWGLLHESITSCATLKTRRIKPQPANARTTSTACDSRLVYPSVSTISSVVLTSKPTQTSAPATFVFHLNVATNCKPNATGLSGMPRL